MREQTEALRELERVDRANRHGARRIIVGGCL
jgi:hypothetical protein